MIRESWSWGVPAHAAGPELEAAVEAMNLRGPFTVDDEAVALSPRCVELVDGKFRIVSSASPLHGYTQVELAVELRRLVGKRGVVIAECGVRTSGNRTLREADVAVYLGWTPGELRGETWARVPPDLVVEVLSPSTTAEDRGPKRREYEAAGVRELVLVDPDARTVEVFQRVGDALVPLERGPHGWSSPVLLQTWRPDALIPG